MRPITLILESIYVPIKELVDINISLHSINNSSKNTEIPSNRIDHEVKAIKKFSSIKQIQFT
jgi:hypothetical protein